MFFKDPFRLVPVNDIAEIADKFTRNEILTSNEIRQLIGMKPSDDPKADKLINSNLNQPESVSQGTDERIIEGDCNQETVGEKYSQSLGNIPISDLPGSDD